MTKKLKTSTMSRDEKLVFYAQAPRAYAGKIHKYEKGNFVTYWAGKLRGIFVSPSEGDFKFNDKAQAIECARQFRRSCQEEAVQRGLLSATCISPKTVNAKTQ